MIPTEGIARLRSQRAIGRARVKPGRFEACLRLLHAECGQRRGCGGRQWTCRGIFCRHLGRLPGAGTYLGCPKLGRRQACCDDVAVTDRLLVVDSRRHAGSRKREPDVGFPIVLRDAYAFHVEETEVILGFGILLVCRQAKPLGRLAGVPGDAVAVCIQDTEIILRASKPLLLCPPEPLGPTGTTP